MLPFFVLLLLLIVPDTGVAKDDPMSAPSQSTTQLPDESFRIPASRYRQRQYRNETVYDYLNFTNGLNSSLYSENDPLLRTYYPQVNDPSQNQPAQNKYDAGQETGFIDSNAEGYDIYDSRGNKVGSVHGNNIYNNEGDLIGHTSSQGSTGGFILFDKKPRNRDASGQNR